MTRPPTVAVAEGGDGGADAATLRVIVAAVEASLLAHAREEAPKKRRADRMWRFSGREWAAPGPLRRART